MACGQLSNVTYDLCTGNLGGLSKIWLCDAESISGISIGTSTAYTQDVVTAVTFTTGDTKFMPFTMKKNTASFQSEVTVGDSNTYVSTTLNLVFPHQDSNKRVAAQSLLLAEAVAICLDKNNHYWLIGSKDNPLSIESGSADSGTNKDDSNNYTIAVSCESTEFPYEVDASIISTICA